MERRERRERKKDRPFAVRGSPKVEEGDFGGDPDLTLPFSLTSCEVHRVKVHRVTFRGSNDCDENKDIPSGVSRI